MALGQPPPYRPHQRGGCRASAFVIRGSWRPAIASATQRSSVAGRDSGSQGPAICAAGIGHLVAGQPMRNECSSDGQAIARGCLTPTPATPAPLLLRFARSNAPPSVEAPLGRLLLPAFRLARSVSRNAIPVPTSTPRRWLGCPRLARSRTEPSPRVASLCRCKFARGSGSRG
jgi:hypothetical protein